MRVCKRAGITVRMVTGDNTYTAQHIARECGILGEGGVALEGPDFRNRSDEELKEILPSVQVHLPCFYSSDTGSGHQFHLLKDSVHPGEMTAALKSCKYMLWGHQALLGCVIKT